MPTALILGITGQDGAYLADFLLNKGYKVRGVIRRSSSFNTGRIDYLTNLYSPEQFNCFRGDLMDVVGLVNILKQTNPDEIYNLAAQSHVRISFDIPTYTAETIALGTLNLLEAIRTLGLKCKIYQASSSEMFGSAAPPQNELTQFHPRSPYAVSKVAAYHFCVNYREAYGMHISNGILFNHESPFRGGNFVTKKITKAVSRIKFDLQKELVLGNLEAKRDWGYAKDYVEAMWLMLQQNTSNDFVIATGESHTVREFVEKCFKYIDINIIWNGSGLDEIGIDSKTDRVLVRIDSKYFRPTEADYLLGNYSKAKTLLNWEPKVKFNELIKIMMASDLNETIKEMNTSDLYVPKPWGFEHTIFKDNSSLVLRLCINKGESTSYHCHQHKKTMMIVVNGKVKLHTHDNETILLDQFDSRVIDIFINHAIEAVSDTAEVLEIDSPPLILDIVRYKDKYGRENKAFYPEESK